MDLPNLGHLVTIVDPAHPLVGESGTVTAYHGVLRDSVFVDFGKPRAELLPVEVLAWERQ